MLNGILCDKNTSKISNTTIKSTTTYSSEDWPFKEKTVNMLTDTEINFRKEQQADDNRKNN